jgi:hypothetical protein
MLVAGWRRMSVFVRDDTVSTGRPWCWPWGRGGTQMMDIVSTWRRMMRSGLRDGARPGSLQHELPRRAPQK